MKLNLYAISFLLSMLVAPALQAQRVYKPYDPYWQWGRADTGRSFQTPGRTVLAVHNNRALWGRMVNMKHTLPTGEPLGDWTLNEYDSLGRPSSTTTTVRGKVQLIDAKTDAAGNWYVLGRWYDTALFTVNAPYLRTSPATNTDPDHFIVRFDGGSLTPSWIMVLGPSVSVSARSFVVDKTRLLVAADSGTVTRVLSLNTANGSPTTLFRQAGASTTTSIQVDGSGAIYLAGTCASGGINFNGASEPATAEPHSYIVKYRPNGTHIWHQWHRDNACHPRKLSLYGDHVLYYSGTITDSFTLGGLYLQPLAMSHDYMIARMDTAGRVSWLRQQTPGSGSSLAIPGDPYHAVVMPDTSLVLFTQAREFLDWGDTLSSYFPSVNAAALVSIGSDSRARWVRDVYADVVMNQHVAAEGTAVWISGCVQSKSGTVTMDTMRTRTAANRYTPFLAKTRMIRPKATAPGVGVGEADAAQFRAYPVPASTMLAVEGFGPESLISLIDMSGRRIRQEAASGRQRVTFDVSKLPRGHYVLELRDSDGSRTVRRIALQ